MWDVVGQDRAVRLLGRSLEAGSLSHAYLLVGPPHVGKMTLARDLAQAVNCEGDDAPGDAPCGGCVACRRIAEGKHADVQVVDLASANGAPESESRVRISVEQIEQLQHSASLPPFEGRCKVFVLDRAEQLSIGAANRLLKTLEEPVDNVLFVLLTAREGQLPATVVSRCQRIALSPMGSAEMEQVLVSRFALAADLAKRLSRLANGCLGWALTAAGDGEILRQRTEWLDELLEITDAGFERRFSFVALLANRFSQNRRTVQDRLDLWLSWWRDLLLVKVGCSDAVTNVDRAGRLGGVAEEYTLAQIRAFVETIRATAQRLELNANPLLALEVLMLSIPEQSGTTAPAGAGWNNGSGVRFEVGND